MEAITEIGTALFAATVLVSLFTILRSGTRSPSSPPWLANDLTAYGLAVGLTVALAASFFYLGFALQAYLLNPALAGFASIGAHMALLALFRLLLPVTDEIGPSEADTRKQALKAASA